MNVQDITVIVPTRNERHNIHAFLSSLPAQTKLICVDSSDDDTPDLIRKYRPAHTHLIESRCNITHARQMGADAAHTPWLLFTDADITLPHSYFVELAHLSADADDEMPGLIYGPKRATDRFTRYHRWFERGQEFFARLGIPAATGSNMLIYRDVLRKVGGFDLRLTCNEDSELAWRIRRAGFRAVFAPQLVVYSRDHRRLERGVAKKIAHTTFRCLLLYFNLMPSRWRTRDWGYWQSMPRASPVANAAYAARSAAPPPQSH